MKFTAYLFGLACVSLLVSGVTYFPAVFISMKVANFVPLQYQTTIIYLFFPIPFILGVTYFVRGVLTVKRKGLPLSFSGWRYALVLAGFSILLLSALPLLVALFRPPMTGSLSGVPLGLGMLFSVLLVLPAMATSLKNDNPR